MSNVKEGAERRALSSVAVAYADMKRAKETYRAALLHCIRLDIPNTTIASKIGITEAAIRLFRKRNGL